MSFRHRTEYFLTECIINSNEDMDDSTMGKQVQTENLKEIQLQVQLLSASHEYHNGDDNIFCECL